MLRARIVSLAATLTAYIACAHPATRPAAFVPGPENRPGTAALPSGQKAVPTAESEEARAHPGGDPEGREKAPDRARFMLADVFELEWATDPRISPDGRRVAYLRNFMDIMKDRRRSGLWVVDVRGGAHRPLATGHHRVSTPRWSPTGDRLLYATKVDGQVQLLVRWMDTGMVAPVTRVSQAPQDAAWSPDGRWIALTMKVPKKPKPLVQLPAKPKGAKWADAPRVVDRIRFRADGSGYVEPGYVHAFIVPADGGTPRQLTQGDFHHREPAWAPDGRSLILSANRRADWEYEPRESELYRVDVMTGAVTPLTRRTGPDYAPAVSPDGRTVAYLGYDDRELGFQKSTLYVLNLATGRSRPVSDGFDRSIRDFRWDPAGRGLFIQYDDQGNGKLAFMDRRGRLTPLARDVGGTVLGRPYSGGSFTVARDGSYAFTMTRPDHPADVAVGRRGRAPRRLTNLNEDLFAHKVLGAVEEFRVPSRHDQLDIHGWIVRPPGAVRGQKHPLILEIHGGPFANYGDRFSAEVQLYAAAGYVVLYVNPRGSTSYGEAFANKIHHAYPGHDYEDLMSAVDAAVEWGLVDPERMFVTGGSGGGVLAAWTIGKTHRFRAAVVAKPVVNWLSFVFTSDFPFFHRYWFSGFPWEAPESYLQRSPLFLAGAVQTPTMLLTGESDLRTPIGESEQLYVALKARKVDTVLVRIPGASHRIAQRPSQLIAKVAHVLAWFDRYGRSGAEDTPGSEAPVQSNLLRPLRSPLILGSAAVGP